MRADCIDESPCVRGYRGDSFHSFVVDTDIISPGAHKLLHGADDNFSTSSAPFTSDSVDVKRQKGATLVSLLLSRIEWELMLVVILMVNN